MVQAADSVSWSKNGRWNVFGGQLLFEHTVLLAVRFGKSKLWQQPNLQLCDLMSGRQDGVHYRQDVVNSLKGVSFRNTSDSRSPTLAVHLYPHLITRPVRIVDQGALTHFSTAIHDESSFLMT